MSQQPTLVHTLQSNCCCNLSTRCRCAAAQLAALTKVCQAQQSGFLQLEAAWPSPALTQALVCRRSFSDAIIVGLFRGKDRRPVLNPGEKTILEDNDRLIMLSHTSMPCAADAVQIPVC